jgi:hypothetical protein
MRKRAQASQRMIAAEWARLGVMLNVSPAARTPDLESLLLQTASAARHNSRLLIAGATWLVCYGDYVAKRRLAVKVREELATEDRPVMGMMLDWVRVQDARHRHRFEEAIALCGPAAEAGPLLEVCRGNRALWRLAEAQASGLSRRWGCWMEEFAPRWELIRPAEWVARHNPGLAIRALCGGDLVATIVADAGAGAAEFRSEAALARRYGASRAAVRDALRKLKLAGYAAQATRGRAHAIVMAAHPEAMAPGELDRLLEEGERSIAEHGTLDGEQAFQARNARRHRA